MAANVPKRLVTQVIKARSFSSTVEPRTSAHGGENAERLRIMWKRIAMAGFPVLGICMVYNYLVHVEHEKHWKQPEYIPYSYLNIRKKKFPWGDGNHSLFHNPKHNALPDGYESS